MLPRRTYMRQRDAKPVLQVQSTVSSGGQLPVPPALGHIGRYTQIPTLPCWSYIIWFAVKMQ